MSRLVDERELSQGFGQIRMHLYESDKDETLAAIKELQELMVAAMDRYEQQEKKDREGVIR